MRSCHRIRIDGLDGVVQRVIRGPYYNSPSESVSSPPAKVGCTQKEQASATQCGHNDNPGQGFAMLRIEQWNIVERVIGQTDFDEFAVALDPT